MKFEIIFTLKLLRVCLSIKSVHISKLVNFEILLLFKFFICIAISRLHNDNGKHINEIMFRIITLILKESGIY
jgi:hypothetical protein